MDALEVKDILTGTSEMDYHLLVTLSKALNLSMTWFLISFKKGKQCINEDKAVMQINSGTDYWK